MGIFKDVSIEHKLSSIAILPSTLALLTAVLIFFIFDEITFKRSMVQNVTMLSQVIGANNSAALLFNDQKSAEDNLAVLSASPHVILGCIYTIDGAVFARYVRSDARNTQVMPALPAEGTVFGDDFLAIIKKIELNGKTIGTMYLQHDLETLHARRNGYITIAAIILMMLSGLVFVLSFWLKKAVSNPLLILVETAKAISMKKDYSIRIHGKESNEIGTLISGFNEMLEQIQERDAKLALNSEALEQQVAIRTAELTASNESLRIQIEENAKIEEELFRTRQLESLGLLAGGIAHDFNNLLAAILMNVSLSQKYTSSDSKIFARLESVEIACNRARDLTQQLLTFSKGGNPLTKVTSIAEVIEESARFVLRGSKSRCSFAICDDLWPVEVDEGQISQVIHNLAINADQAMPDGGTILISVENMVVDTGARLNLSPGRYVTISIKDSGNGIPKEQLPMIFTPYFTTKKSGSGLGLATSYSIISKHNGLIMVESEIGAGTMFHIYLPASDKEITETANKVDSEISGSGRVLVMDDEELILAVTEDALSNAGYIVASAPDGAEAIKMYQAAQASGKPYDLIIMDLTIPGGMGGAETIKKLLQIDPDAKTIASSGYAHDIVMSDYKSYGFKGILVKPFSINTLCKVVCDVINSI